MMSRRTMSTGTRAVLIDGSGFTKIGDMTSNGGLAASFDLDNNEAKAQCSAANGASAGPVFINRFCGIDLGAGNEKQIHSATTYGSNDVGYGNNPASRSMNVWLYASNVAPTGEGDGTQLASQGGVDDQTTQPFLLNSSDRFTYFRFVWCSLRVAVAAGSLIFFGELEIKELKA